ncbi:MAG: hypothetical protein ACYTGC_13055 [Planctomycetota bacterium]|jgi:hypothetical protein
MLEVGLLLLLLVGLLLVVHRGPRVRAPSCGGCGYAVAGLATLRCPECGADLREVGIRTPSPQRGRSVGWVAIWTLGLLLTATLVSPALRRWVPRRYSTVTRIDVAPQRISSYEGVRAHLVGTGRAGRNRYHRASLQVLLAGNAFSEPMDVDLRDLTYRVRRPDGSWHHGPGALDGRRLAGWMASMAGESSSAVLAAEAAAILDYLDGARKDGGVSVGRSPALANASVQTTTTAIALPWLSATITAGWLALWLLGGVLIAWRWRARERSAGSRHGGEPRVPA